MLVISLNRTAVGINVIQDVFNFACRLVDPHMKTFKQATPLGAR